MINVKGRIEEIERAMSSPDFWQDKHRAQKAVQELQELKSQLSGEGKYDKGDAIMTIFAGAGGDDAEDFTAMLYAMYRRYVQRQGWSLRELHAHANDHGGYRNVTCEIGGNRAYGILKNESGVHRLVRISPFSAKKLRHTSFALVEVIPKFEDVRETDIPERELKIEFARSSGPGGQNVNKRETAVRMVHIPTGISVHVDSERSQAQNKQKALAILKGKLYKMKDKEQKSEKAGMYVSKTTEAEWGSQIRSYVLHPYKLVKDHRTNVEVSNAGKVLEEGYLDEFIEAEKGL